MPNKVYRILHIFSSYGGGISSLILNLIENKRDDYTFDIMAFGYVNADSFLDRVRKKGGKVYQMPRPRIDGYKKFINYVNNVMSENEYDAIHCHITGWHAMPFASAAKKHGIKSFIFHAHTTKYDSRIDRIPLVQVYNKYFNFKNSSAYMTCSDLAADYIYGERYLAKRNAYLIPNGINEDFFSDKLKDEQKSAYYQEFNVSDKSLIIGHVGRFSYPKNYPFILKIIKGLKEKGLDFVFVFVGDGELLDSVKQNAETEGLSENIRFPGRRTDISTLMRFFDCMILPSLYEGLPTVAVECQAAGTPMILSDKITKQCDMKLDLIKFLPIDDAKLWTDSIESVTSNKLQDNSACLTQIRSLGFTAKESGKQYCDILKEIIEESLDN